MNIYLIGYRGSGKSTLGKIISEKLNFEFTDTDDLIIKAERKTIPEIFEKAGESYFRKIESDALKKISGRKNLVVSTGGGIILNEKNRALMRKTGFCVYLKADTDILFRRIEGDGNRPPLTKLPPREEVDHILSLRIPLYTELAELSLDTGEFSAGECAEKIIQALKTRGEAVC